MKSALILAVAVALVLVLAAVYLSGRAPAPQAAPLCIGGRTGNTLAVAPATAGVCPPGELLCPALGCSGPIPSCVSPTGATDGSSCPVCVGGAPGCAVGSYYRTDPATWQMGPSGASSSPNSGAAANFPYCSSLGDDCEWAAINSNTFMDYAGRGKLDAGKTTGYRVVSSTGAAFYRDAGRDNTLSFDDNGLSTSYVGALADCEQAALEPSTNGGVPVDGGYAYVFDAPGGVCDVYRLQGGMRTQGTMDYVKAR